MSVLLGIYLVLLYHVITLSLGYQMVQVRVARKSLELARPNLSYTRLKATNICVVAEINEAILIDRAQLELEKGRNE